MDEEVPAAKGVAVEEQVRYVHVKAWAKELGVPVEQLRELLKDVPSITGRTDDGDVTDFYPEGDVRRVTGR